jgi:uncharacterized protein (TIGR02118 family)
MPNLSVLYPKTDSSTFDHDYYLERHIPLVRSLLTRTGLERIDLMRGQPALDGTPPTFELIGLLTFPSVEQLLKGLDQAGPILADIPNFTNVQPLLQVNEPISS